MRFPPTESEIKAFKARLVKSLSELLSLAISAPEQKVLSEMQERLKKAKTDRDLMRIHRQMTSEFSIYSEGRDLFGPPLASKNAPAGTYRVTLTVDGRPFHGTVSIRNDPLLK